MTQLVSCINGFLEIKGSDKLMTTAEWRLMLKQMFWMLPQKRTVLMLNLKWKTSEEKWQLSTQDIRESDRESDFDSDMEEEKIDICINQQWYIEILKCKMFKDILSVFYVAFINEYGASSKKVLSYYTRRWCADLIPHQDDHGLDQDDHYFLGGRPLGHQPFYVKVWPCNCKLQTNSRLWVQVATG